MLPASPVGQTFYVLPESENLPWRRKGLLVSLVIGLHVFALILAFVAVIRPEIRDSVKTVTARIIELAPVEPNLEPPKPKPTEQVKTKKVFIAQQRLITAAPQSITTNSFAVETQPPSPPMNAVLVATRQPSAIVAARFDADYLRNPKPVYPPMARSMGEEGKVVLRVKVSAQGLPINVDIKQSSGFQRLDEAALAAVERWHFIPARQGDEPIDSSVLVPLQFSLDN